MFGTGFVDISNRIYYINRVDVVGLAILPQIATAKDKVGPFPIHFKSAKFG